MTAIDESKAWSDKPSSMDVSNEDTSIKKAVEDTFKHDLSSGWGRQAFVIPAHRSKDNQSAPCSLEEARKAAFERYVDMQTSVTNPNRGRYMGGPLISLHDLIPFQFAADAFRAAHDPEYLNNQFPKDIGKHFIISAGEAFAAYRIGKVLPKIGERIFAKEAGRDFATSEAFFKNMRKQALEKIIFDGKGMTPEAKKLHDMTRDYLKNNLIVQKVITDGGVLNEIHLISGGKGTPRMFLSENKALNIDINFYSRPENIEKFSQDLKDNVLNIIMITPR